MPDLSGTTARPAPEHATRHDGGGYPRPEVQIPHRERPAPQRGSTQCRCLDVVLDAHGHSENRSDGGGKIERLDAEVDGVFDPA